MHLFCKKAHHQAENLKIVSFRDEARFVPLEERNYFGLQIFPAEDLKPITVLMIGTCIFLKVHTPTSEKTLQCKENFFIALDEFDVEFWFYFYPPNGFAHHVWIPDIDGKASFSVYQSNYIFWTKIFH